MRNPLTASQQVHQNQIFSKITQVVTKHLQNLPPYLQNEFLWELIKRNSKLNIYEDILAHNRGYYAKAN